MLDVSDLYTHNTYKIKDGNTIILSAQLAEGKSQGD